MMVDAFNGTRNSKQPAAAARGQNVNKETMVEGWFPMSLTGYIKRRNASFAIHENPPTG